MGVHVCKMSYQLVISGVVQHPGEIGMFYGCHFTDAKWALESNEVFGLREPRKLESAESTDFLRPRIVMQVPRPALTTPYWLCDFDKVIYLCCALVPSSAKWEEE